MAYMVIVFVCVILYLIYNWFNNLNGDYFEKRNIVYVKRKTPLGVIGDVLFNNRSLPEVYRDIYQKYNTESNVGVFFGTLPALLIRDPENVQAVLAGDFRSFHSRGFALPENDVLADNLIAINEYPRWKLIRQKLSPVFTSAKLKNMFYIMERCGRDFADFVGQPRNAKAEQFDLLYTYSTASIAASIFGIDAQTNTMDSPFLEMSKAAVKPTVKAAMAVFLGNLSPFLQKLSGIKMFGDHEKFFVGVVKQVLRSRETEKQSRHDFIDICLDLQKSGTMKDAQTGYELQPTDELLAAQAFFFFIAGADTTANTMHFALNELANNPHILKRLHEEIDKVMDECNGKLTYDETDKLTYLDMVLNETLRKYPPIGHIQRKCTMATKLPAGNVTIDKDQIVIVPLFALHRDEKFYPNPDVFDPERFSPENIKNIKNGTYLPFGEGNRICIGNRYARLQILAGMACLLHRYTLLPQKVTPERFEKSFFSLRAIDTKFTLLPRNVKA